MTLDKLKEIAEANGRWNCVNGDDVLVLLEVIRVQREAIEITVRRSEMPTMEEEFGSPDPWFEVNRLAVEKTDTLLQGLGGVGNG